MACVSVGLLKLGFSRIMLLFEKQTVHVLISTHQCSEYILDLDCLMYGNA